MNTPNGLKRRHFVAMMAGLAVSAAAITPMIYRSPKETRRLAGLVQDKHSARAIAEKWVELRPDAKGDAVRKLVEALGGSREIARSTNQEIIARLRERMREDFASSNTVNIEGWTLTETEARLSVAVL